MEQLGAAIVTVARWVALGVAGLAATSGSVCRFVNSPRPSCEHGSTGWEKIQSGVFGGTEWGWQVGNRYAAQGRPAADRTDSLAWLWHSEAPRTEAAALAAAACSRAYVPTKTSACSR